MKDYEWILLFMAGVFLTIAVYATYRLIGTTIAYLIYRREIRLWKKGERSRNEIDYREFNILGPLLTAGFSLFVALSLWASIR